jgi:hypothetical protein
MKFLFKLALTVFARDGPEPDPRTSVKDPHPMLFHPSICDPGEFFFPESLVTILG